MKEKLKRIVEEFKKYNSGDPAKRVFGLDADESYEALVIAPTIMPHRFLLDENEGWRVTVLRESMYMTGYLIEKDGAKIAWIKIGPSAGNTIDRLAICAELKIKRLIFIGAVGALKPGFELGDLAVPSYSISASLADAFLTENSIHSFTPFQRVDADERAANEVIALAEDLGYSIKRASVFCTPSIALEYYHLNEIHAMGTDLIEMETASFYLMAELMELPAVALLVVSDNSATGAPLIGRTDEQQERFERGVRRALRDTMLAYALGKAAVE